MARRKKRVKKEPKPPTWMIFKCHNQTKEEVYLGVTTYCGKRDWKGNKRCLIWGVKELAHWDLKEDHLIICRNKKRRRIATELEAKRYVQDMERNYEHSRNFWVIQTGANTLLPPRIRKPVKPVYSYNYSNFEFLEEDDFKTEMALELVGELASAEEIEEAANYELVEEAL